ncbi:MAG: hypothetical protein EHM72_00235 [Calditrichaeota bacterium]|nr:MAG: hypothetical protein EHM72_00235 [Calditrichota bacterium]
MIILGISCFYHDSAACIVRDGEIAAAAQEERFSRIKHDQSFPRLAIQACLRQAQITIDQVDVIAFYDKPFIKFERILETYLSYAPSGLSSFLLSLPLWLKKKLWIPDLIRKESGFDGDLVFPEHHESHAASAFFPSPFQQAAFLTTDGVGEWTTTSYGIGQDNRLSIEAEIHFPHSLGLLYSAFTYYTGFRVNSGEYKVMGLAPYGEPKYVQTIYDHLVDLKEDGSFKLNMDYFNYGAGLTMTNSRFHRLFGGPPRKPETLLTQKEMDIARSIQEVTEEIMLRCARFVHQQTGQKNLCLAGGVALNCVANGRILREGPFDNIWIQPAAGDAGGALGAALFCWYQIKNNARQVDDIHDLQKASLIGPAYSDQEIKQFLDQHHLPYVHYADEELIDRTAQLIAEENVVAWFQGRMEFGPRALGSRSILGDARSPSMQSRMNLKIKFRESFRPFAPSVLEEYAADYFEIDVPSPYMLLVAQVHKDHCKPMTDEQQKLWGIDKLNVIRSDVPAITHIDYSARLQTVSAEHGRYYDLLKCFHQKTGCPVIINTSFNVRGEPIVGSPEDAYRCFMRTEMDYLVIGNFIVNKKDQPPLIEKQDWKKTYELD